MISYSLSAFIGYSIGRFGHIYGGQIAFFPHHLIVGLFLVVLSLFWRNKYFKVMIFCFGIGIFVSDFDDFLGLKFWEADNVIVKKFWGFD